MNVVSGAPGNEARAPGNPALKGDYLLLRSLLLVLSLSLPNLAAQPVVGEKAPDVPFKTVDGETLLLSELTGRGPVVLVVLRGYPGYQCPYCNRQVQDFLQAAPDFNARGAHVVLVYPGPPGEAERRGAEFVMGKQLPANFDLALDPGYEFTSRYGLRWDAPRETAYPATFVIDRSGVVSFAKIVKSHGGRTTAKEVIEVLPRPQGQRKE